MSIQDSISKRAGLSDAKRALLEKRLRGEAHAARPREVVTRTDDPGPSYPPSYAQERLWYVAQLQPESGLYNVPVSVLIKADVDVAVLEKAVTEVVRRHESLRTVFRMENGELRQVVLPPMPVTVEVKDVRGRIGANRANEDIRRLVSEEGARPFDLTEGPLARWTLLRVSDERMAMVTTVHHIATDGWAMPLVIRETDELYSTYARGLPSPFPDPGLRYVDYTLWQRNYLQGETLERQIGYWRDHLADAPDTEVLGDRPRPAVQHFHGSSHRFNISTEVSRRLRQIGVEETASVNMVLLAVFSVLLQRYTGDEAVTVGSLHGNRNRGELEDVMGYFINTIALKIDLAGDPTFREVVRQAKKVILDADRNQDMPFEKLVDILGVPRDPSRNPLFQIMYFHHTFVRVHRAAREGMASMLDPQPIYDENSIALVDTGASKFDITVATLEHGEALKALIEYSTDLFDHETILRFAKSFQALLDSAGRNPDARVSTLEVVAPDERGKVLADFAIGPRADHPIAPFHRLFEANAERAPHAPAVSFEGLQLSYGELNARANRLARRLRALGVGPETVVAISLDRSPVIVEAVLAVLKAGGAYLPVDPAYPSDRRRYMLEDSGAKVLITQQSLVADLPPNAATLFVIDAEREATAAEDASNLDIDVDVENAAYVIYTSGSTGRPKGVVVPHRGIGNLAASQTETFGLTPESRMLQFASFSFDAAAGDIVDTLYAGACLVMASADRMLPGPGLLELMKDERVTTALIPPSVLAALPDAHLPDLATLIVGGEAVSPETVRRWSAGRRFINAYGPTEATVCVTSQVDPTPDGRVSIGTPIDNVRVYVLDRAGLPLPPGAPGELYVGGVSVARGYLGRPGLTAERFVPDPFSDVPGARLYRTGDRARWREDGRLDFLGRIDQQVKVRGFRIELGEIESVLAEQPGVREAAVIVREEAGHPRLAAYAAGDGLDQAELRKGMAARLPDYMVPAQVVVLPTLPKTPNGKLDRRALPAPEALAIKEAAGEYAAPTGEVEEILTRIWAEVLRLEKVGIHDDFFAAGGDSILSIRVIARAAQEGVRITPRQMFEHHTIAELAKVAGTAARVDAEQGPVTGEAPLTPIQRWFFSRDVPEAHHWNMSQFLAVRDRLDPAAVEAAVGALLAHHDALRARFSKTADGWTVTYAEPGAVPFEVIDLSSIADADLPAAIEARASVAQASLDLANGVFKAVLFDAGEGRPQRLLLVVHHLVVDAVSWTLLLPDLETALTQVLAGEEPKLTEKTTSFRAWAEKLVEHAGSPEAAAEADFWLESVPLDAPMLIADDPQAADTEGSTRAAHVELDEDETRALLTEVPLAYQTQINDALLAALARAYAAWSGDDRLLLGLEGHGREDLFEDVDLSRTVGWFTTEYPVLLAAPEHPGEALKAVKETLRSVPRKGIGYGLLRWLGDAEVRTELALRPHPEVSFNYLGQMGGHAPAPKPAAAASAPATSVEPETASADAVPVEARGPLLSPARESMGPGRSPRGTRGSRIAVEGMVVDGRLRMSFWFGGDVFRQETIDRLAEAFERSLTEIIEHCRHPEAGGFTPSDFPEAGLDQDALDALMARLGG